MFFFVFLLLFVSWCREMPGYIWTLLTKERAIWHRHMPVTATWTNPSNFDGLFHFHWHKFSLTIPSEPEGVVQCSLSEPLGPAFAFPRVKKLSKWCTNTPLDTDC